MAEDERKETEEEEGKQRPFTKKAHKQGEALSVALQDARIKGKYTQKGLAAAMGVSDSVIKKTEQNTNTISAYVFLEYCRILNVPPEEFMLKTKTEKEQTMIGEIEKYLTVLPDDMLEAVHTIVKQYAEKSRNERH